MCAEKTEDKSKKSTNSCCNGMEEMMENCFPQRQEAADCCAQRKDKCGSGTDRNTNGMTMFQQTQNWSCGRANEVQSGKGSGCCA